MRVDNASLGFGLRRRQRRADVSQSSLAGTGRRALRTMRRVQVPASERCVSVSRKSFASCFVPYRRVICADSDLAVLTPHFLSVSCLSVRPSVSSRSVGRRWVGTRGLSACCSRCAGSLVGGSEALCGVCTAQVRVYVDDLGSDHSDHNSWKHGPEVARSTKASYQCTGATVGRTFVVLCQLGQHWHKRYEWSPEGTHLEAAEGRIFTCPLPTTQGSGGR